MIATRALLLCPVGHRPRALSNFPQRRIFSRTRRLRPLLAEQVQEDTTETVKKETTTDASEQTEAERVTKKWGLEAGLFKVRHFRIDTLSEVLLGCNVQEEGIYGRDGEGAS